MATATAPHPLKVLVFAAALRKESRNRKLAILAARVAREFGADVDLASMGDFDVPLYDADVEVASGIPSGAKTFHDRLLASDAFIISSPEYVFVGVVGMLAGAIEEE